MMKNEILSWFIQTSAQLMALTALVTVLAFSLLHWRAIARLRRELQDDLAEVTSRLTMVAQASAGAPPAAPPVLQPAASQSMTPPTAADASEHHGRQDYATAQRLAARGAHSDALVERCGLSPAEAHILVAMHEMKPAKG
jgi:hypothetical protein